MYNKKIHHIGGRKAVAARAAEEGDRGAVAPPSENLGDRTCLLTLPNLEGPSSGTVRQATTSFP